MNEALLMFLKKISLSVQGVFVVMLFAITATFFSTIGFIKNSGISPVISGIIIGVICGNTIPSAILARLKPGIIFSATYILRAAIIFYGFRITFQNVFQVGTQGLLVSVGMVASTLLLGIFLGKKIFKMDTSLALLTAAGSAICGAAAVLATESVAKADRHKSVIAVSTVVLFGTISMVVYPALYHSGILGMNDNAFGIYIGGSVHEVAHVVVAGNGVSETAAASGIIVKMTRVMLLAPLLITLGFFRMRKNKFNSGFSGKKIPIPYFVFGFIAVIGLNSMNIFSQNIVEAITLGDTFLLTMAMCALGMETDLSKFREAGTKPVCLAGLLFIWLLAGGYLVTKCVTEL